MIRPIRSPQRVADENSAIPPLENGDHLDQKTFHERYEAMPEGTRAELIGGIVFMASPLKAPHGRNGLLVVRWLLPYEDQTPGVETLENATAILSDDCEPQPDFFLRILRAGGQTREEDEFIVGAPELVVEISSSTEAIDLHRKKEEYERAGVREYVVLALRQRRVFWFILRNGQFENLNAGPDGLLRSEAFPGLWLDPESLVNQDKKRLREVIDLGLASPEHAAFVAKLAAQEK